ncbi:uncharacterized protein LOC110924087 [Helianthus annuus]|uniref:uncharacterized protein LOC110924087 n=1 Tax=Helianthus annuus TaxID=4232 RepID=UPI000B902E18|nr:uncharacterized protein LOC110924087 [Helianthus annuus]
MLDRIATAVTLRNRGVNIPKVVCKICGAADETAVHILLQCNYAKRVWEEITNWIKIPIIDTDGDLKKLMKDINDIQRNWKIKKVIHAVTIQTLWSLWRARNDKVFKGKHEGLQIIVEDIKELPTKV